MVGIVLLGVFVVLLVFGAPIAVCLGMSSVGAILAQGAGKPLDAIMSVLPRLCSSASSKFVLLAIPFFILSGNVMEKAGISGRLINLAEKCLGHIRGGMAMVCVVVSCFFAAISGSGPATVAAVGLFTPPVGVNLYVACGIGKIKIEEITKGIVPCLVAELVVLLLVTYIPALSTMLVG